MNKLIKIITILILTTLITSSISINAKDLNQIKNLDINSENNYTYFRNIKDHSYLENMKYMPTEFLVKFKQNVNLNEHSFGSVTTGIPSVDKLNQKYQINDYEKLTQEYTNQELTKVYLLKLSEEKDIISIVQEYNEDENILLAEPNYIYEANNIPNDPYFDLQWHLNQDNNCDINAPEAWGTDNYYGTNDVTIAVIDSGVDYTNPEFGNYPGENIVELDYVIETPHPFEESKYEVTYNFNEIFSNYDFDTISFHIDRVDFNGDGDFEIVENTNRLIPQYLFSSFFNQNNACNDIWTIYSQTDRNIYDFNLFKSKIGGCYGFRIDKVRLHKFKPLSQISDKFVDGHDFFNLDSDPMDGNGHGTHCAGIIAALTNNNKGVAGIASNCKIMPVKVMHNLGFGTAFNIAAGVIYAANNGADILSLSLGGPESSVQKSAIDYAYNKGCTIISAAGNDGVPINTLSYPAAYDNVISVSATEKNDELTSWSTYGSWVDIAAPGYDIVSLRAYGTDMYAMYGVEPGSNNVPAYDKDAILYRASGTSMSCPVVAGVSALILSKAKEQGLNLNSEEIRTILKSSTDPIQSNKIGGTGRINAQKAIEKTAKVLVNLDDSLNNKNLEGQTSIKGTVKVNNIDTQDFTIEIGKWPYPDEWTELNINKNSNNLADWNTKDVEDGRYILRLTTEVNNQNFEDRADIIVDNKMTQYIVDIKNTDGPWKGTVLDPFQRVQSAVDFAGNKDVIYVRNGEYEEQIISYKKSVKLMGQDKDRTIIKNIDKEYGTIITFEGKLDISKLTIKSSSYYDEWYYGIEVYDTTECRITDNKFIQSRGIIAGASTEKKIENVDIHDNNLDGGEIYCIFLTDGKIHSNKVTNSGIILDYSNNNEVYSNIVSRNTYPDSCRPGVLLTSSSDNKVYKNKISNIRTTGYWEDGTGISLFMYSKRNSIYQNSINENNIGIEILDSVKNEVYKNSIEDNDYGIKIVSYYSEETDMENKIYQNNFINNDEQANDSAINTWYNKLKREGNYWDDWNGSGVYDIPGGDNKDLYPSDEPFDFKVKYIRKPSTTFSQKILSHLKFIGKLLYQFITRILEK